MTIKQIRAMTGLSQQAFATKYGIPVRTVSNWECTGNEHRECPDYVKTLLERVVVEDIKIIIDNQTNLSAKAALVKVVSCLAGLDKEYEVTQEDNVYTLKESTQ